ncbi:MAG: glycoside hydrolase family 2 TIM barrel-domain containing protein [Planctomycetia bacterium]|nr:glycoside hydrolase family 2 TIM barrel-domain containing protein [Planctomycetia bacterium]
MSTKILWQKMLCLLRVSLCGILCCSAIEANAQSVVKVVQNEEVGFSLLKDGRPFFICGAGGNQYLSVLREMGGNSMRTWGQETARRDLDNAQKEGLSVALGFWMGHERHGFDYSDPAQRQRQKDEVRRWVLEHKDHPALLVWGIGNEVELECTHEEEIWAQINDLATMIHELDPNHPVMMVVAEIGGEKVRRIHEKCPAVDILGINSYGGAPSLPERYRAAGGKKPYILTEFGPAGHWESPKFAENFAIEPTSVEKAQQYARAYEKAVASERGKLCLGSYVFLWGNKVEATPTWYGMFLPDGSHLAAVETMRGLWGNAKGTLRNTVPIVEKIRVSQSDGIQEGKIISAQCSASDRENDAFVWEWKLIQEAAEYSVGGDAQTQTPDYPEAIVSGQGTPRVEVRLPGGGVFRLYAYVRDGRGGAAFANVLLRGEGEPPVLRLPKVDLPCVVYGDETNSPWVPSGYMGTHQAIRMTTDCRENPRAGETCICAEFLDHSGWGGVLWQSPANDWGNVPGGRDVAEANTLQFWARGERGGETLVFQVGGLENAPFSDSFKTQKREITLTKEWRAYRIALDGLDLRCVKTPFGWVYGSDGTPIKFYLDDIRFLKQEE